MSAELTTDAVIRLGRQMERFDVLFFEEPVDPFDARRRQHRGTAAAVQVDARAPGAFTLTM